MTPGEVQGEMKRHVRPLSLDTTGTSVGVALGNVIRSGSENVVTGAFASIVWAVTSTGMPPADQVIPAGAVIAAPSCGAVSTISASPGVDGTTVAGHATVASWSAVLSEPLVPGCAVLAVGRGTPFEPAAQMVKCVTKPVEVTPSPIVPLTV